MQHKKGSESYRVPVELAFAYRHSRANLIPRPYQAIPPADLPESISTVTEAIRLYRDTFAEQFPGSYSANRKHMCLERFVAYLQQAGHSMHLEDLTTDDGQRFLASLSHQCTGKPFTSQSKNRYKCALRTFSKFLFAGKLLSTDVFFDLA